MKKRHLRAAVAFSLLCGGFAKADVIFSNLGPGNSYNPIPGFLFGATVGTPVAIAMPFTPAGTFTLTQIDVAIIHQMVPNSDINSVVLTLNSDSGGLPGAALMTWNLSGLPTSGVCCTVTTVVPGSPVLLSAGVQYWLAATTASADNLEGWSVNIAGTIGPVAQNVGSGFAFIIDPQPAFDVLGTPAQNPVPTITSLSPMNLAEGGSFTLNVTGTDFVSGATVEWNGSARTTTFVSTTQLQAAISSSDTASPGTVPVTVFNPAPGGGLSNALGFQVTVPTPLLFGISPTYVLRGGPAFGLTVNGSGFLAGAKVLWNGSPLGTNFVSGSQLSASVPANLVASPGTAAVSAINFGGSASNSLEFEIDAPDPVVTSLSPNSAQPGGPGFTLTVNGSAFSPSMIVLWNLSPLATTFISENQLQATVPASLIAQPGGANIDVSISPGTVSNGIPFTIAQYAPAISSLSPNSVPAGSGGFTLTVNGSGFSLGSTVAWNGTTLPTNYVNGNQLTASVPAFFVASQGSASIVATVSQNTTGLTSNVVSFAITPPTPLAIVTSSPLTAGSVGVAYSQTLAASGGSTPYTWTIIAGSLPAGLTLSTAGAITGTPTTAATANFSVRVTDNASSTLTANFSLTIAAASLSFSNALRISQIADGASWKTLFAVVNLDSSPVDYAFQFWDDNGNPLALPILNGSVGTLTGTVGAGGTVFAETPGTAQSLLQGWAEVAGSGRIGVLTIFRQSVPGRPASEGTVTAAPSASTIFVPFDNTQKQVTSVAIANTNPTQTLAVSLLFHLENGGQAAGALTLPPHTHQAFPLPTMFPAVAGLRGSVQFTAPSPDITVVGLRFSPLNSFTSVGAFQ